jgi:hypothetical protein
VTDDFTPDADTPSDDVSRRTFLRLTGAGAAALAAGGAMMH